MRNPIQQDIVINWEDMENIWHHTFHELEVNPQDHILLLTESPCNPRENREKMTEIMFETYNTLGLYVGNHAVLSLFGSGSQTGIVVECGGDVTHTVPIYGGIALPHATLQQDIGQQTITECMGVLLKERGFNLTTTEEKTCIEDIVKKLGYIALDFREEMSITANSCALERSYELPDGQLVDIGNERFRCLEILFDPMIYIGDNRRMGIHEMVYESIRKCDCSLQSEMYDTIVISGDVRGYPGFIERMKKELCPLVQDCYQKVDVLEHPYDFSAWLGGSLFAITHGFEKTVITRENYEEFGPNIVNIKSI